MNTEDLPWPHRVGNLARLYGRPAEPLNDPHLVEIVDYKETTPATAAAATIEWLSGWYEMDRMLKEAGL